MTWAVLDTNVLVSGLGWQRTTPARIVDLALQGRFVIVTSEPLLDELERVLAYPRLAAVIPDPRALARLVAEVAVVVHPERTLAVVERDPADNRVIEAAIAGRADAIVSGDRDLLDLGKFEGVRFLTPRAFLSLHEG